MLFILGFLFVFVLGGLTGVMLASVPFNFQAHDTHFVVAHLHYVLFGGFVFPMFGALYYWVPTFTGRMMSERLGRWVFWLIFAGFNLTFFMMHLTGMRGMPRRVATYPEGIGWDRLNMLSSIGSYMIAAGVALFIWDFFRHRRAGPPAGRNPWGAGTLEWLYPPRPPGYNFRAIPRVHSREPLWDQPELTDRPAAEIDGALRRYPDHRRETMGCDIVTGAPMQILRLPHPTWFPLISAIGLAITFAATLASIYWGVAVGAGVFLIGITGWVWEPSDSGVARDTGLENLRLPVNVVNRRSHLHVGTVGSILISFALFGSLIFAALYLWNTQPVFAANVVPPQPFPAILALAGGMVLAVAGAVTFRVADRGGLMAAAFLDVLLAAAAVGIGALLWATLAPLDPWSSAFAAVLWAVGVFVAAHLAVVLYWALFNAARKLTGATRPGQTLPDLLLGSFCKATGTQTALAAAALLALSGGTP
jgi:cytochrome c oxidase subunit I+III